MSTPEEANPWFDRLGVSDMVRVSDPDKRIYREFGLEQASLWQLIHPRVWLPWMRTAIASRYCFGTAGPNWRQLTGVFVVHRGRILASIRHRNSAARPDYTALVHAIGSRDGSAVASASRMR